MANKEQNLNKVVYMVCLGQEPGIADWYAQTNRLSYGGPQISIDFALS